jgi:hypothetical protein
VGVCEDFGPILEMVGLNSELRVCVCVCVCVVVVVALWSSINPGGAIVWFESVQNNLLLYC